jgi:hypothetical protein
MGSQAPPYTVAYDGTTYVTPDCVGDPRRLRRITWNVGDGQGAATSTSGGAQGDEQFPAVDSPDQADSRARPFSLRDFRMACPARVDIRLRKPCFFARLRLLGWYVRFTHRLLGAASLGPSAEKGEQCASARPAPQHDHSS